MRVARRNMEGFILAATLWVLAAMSVLAAYVHGVVLSQTEQAIMARHSLESELDQRSTEATLVYLLAAGRMNYRGLILEEEQRFSDFLSDGQFLPDHGDAELRVAGEVYAGIGDTLFSIQDEAGLVSVNAPRYPPFAALLKHVGVPSSSVERIVALVEDYIDSDSDLTMNGAEDHDYRRNGLPPPLNWIMASPGELTKVLGVDNLFTAQQQRRLRPLLTMRPVYSYNFNTMRPEVLAALLDLDLGGVQNLLEEREKRSISRMTTIALLSGKHLDIDEMEVRTLPSSLVRIALWRKGGGSRTIAGIALTPLGETVPWRKDYRYSEPVAPGLESGTAREPPLEPATSLL